MLRTRGRRVPGPRRRPRAGSAVPRARLRLPRRTARLRLTLMYAGMFLALGTAVLAVVYGVSASTSAVAVHAVPKPGFTRRVVPGPAGSEALVTLPGIKDALARQQTSDRGQIAEVLWLVLATTAMLSVPLGWFASGRMLRPVRRMTDTARTISAGNLGQRLALTGPDDEFKRLGDTLDDLLARLQAAFDAQRRFVANASHELRTPLTLERTLLQVALSDPDASVASLRATCEELLATGRDQERLLEALLTLASSERGLDRPEPVDLAPLAERSVATASASADARDRGLAVSAALAPAPTSGDAALLERLIGNLVENGARYNEPGGWVRVQTALAGGRATVTVANSGPAVPPGQVERLFEPFARLGRARGHAADGHHGLGLSIVRAIATAHGGTVGAQARPAGGLTVTVHLPGQPGARTPPPPA